MATYSKIVTVVDTDYLTEPDVVIPFVPKVIRACNMDGGDIAFVSMDGRTDAAALSEDMKSPSSVQKWTWQLATKVWLKTANAGVDVQIIAES